MNRSFVASASLSLLLGLAATGVAADKRQPGEEPYRPPAIKLDQGLTLLDAVRLTLQHDPNIKLQSAETRFKEGVTRELGGQFDLTLRSNASYQYNREELRDSTKRREQKNRDDLDATIPKVDAVVGSLSRAVENLRNPGVIEDPSQTDFTLGVTNPQIRQELLRIQTQMILLTQLIQQTADPALREDLEGIRQSILTDGIDAFAQQVDDLKGLPDTVRQARADLGDAPEEQFTKRADFHMDFLKFFRSGIIFSPYAELRYSGQNYVGKDSTDGAKGGQGVPDLYRGEVGFDVRVPLRRGLGSDSVAANENASKKDLESTRLTLFHQEAQSVLQTVLAYWEARAAAAAVEVSKRSVKLQQDLVDLTRELIKAGETPAADEARTLASFADSQARLEAAGRRLHEARVSLARAMGLALPALEAAPVASEDFPVSASGLVAEDAALAALVRTALAQRFDLQAAQMFEQASAILVKGARLDKRRLLNLDGSFWGTSVGENTIKDLDRWVFRSASGALTFEMPLKNNEAQGRFDQRTASLAQASIDATDLGRLVALNVERLARSLQIAGERLRRAQDAVANYDRTIEAEQEKLRAGDSTLVDTILTEQQTTAARLAHVAAQQEYATTLARLRFEAGQLVLRSDDGQARVSQESLLAVPSPLQGAGR